MNLYRHYEDEYGGHSMELPDRGRNIHPGQVGAYPCVGVHPGRCIVKV